MTDEQRKVNAGFLKEVIESEGGKLILSHINEEIRDGWEKFIALPALQKTGKQALNYQARYDVLKDLKDWIASEIKLGV